jgi:phosphohistidine phosphatase
LGTGAEVEFADAIYNASVGQLLALVQDLGDGVSQAMIVGHNPGFEELAALLVRPEDARSLSPAPGKERFPTAGLLLLDFNIVSWADVAPHTGALADFLKPEQNSVG